jgi:hypothetical protein
VTVALVLMMALAVLPPLVDDLRDGKIARTQSEVEIIGHAILAFHDDVGQWPLIAGDRPIAQGRLVGNASLGGGNFGLPTGLIASSASGEVPSKVALGTMTAHLVDNTDSTGEPIYGVSERPYLKPGWNGPYLEEVPLDPWGRPYVVNVAPGCASGTAGSGRVACTITVASRGPNGRFETVLPRVHERADFTGDDVGFVIRAER